MEEALRLVVQKMDLLEKRITQLETNNKSKKLVRLNADANMNKSNKSFNI